MPKGMGVSVLSMPSVVGWIKVVKAKEETHTQAKSPSLSLQFLGAAGTVHANGLRGRNFRISLFHFWHLLMGTLKLWEREGFANIQVPVKIRVGAQVFSLLTVFRKLEGRKKFHFSLLLWFTFKTGFSTWENNELREGRSQLWIHTMGTSQGHYQHKPKAPKSRLSVYRRCSWKPEKLHDQPKATGIRSKAGQAPWLLSLAS